MAPPAPPSLTRAVFGGVPDARLEHHGSHQPLVPSPEQSNPGTLHHLPPVARPREDVLTFVPPRCIYVTVSSRATKSVHPAVVLRRTHIAHAQYQPYPHSVQNKKATLRGKTVRRCSWYKRERDEREGPSTYFLPRFYSIQYDLHFFTCKYLIT